MAKCIGIVGSRRRDSTSDAAATYEAFVRVYEVGDSLVSGGCPKGGDRFCELFAAIEQLTVVCTLLDAFDWPVPCCRIYMANWKTLGRGAGFARNTYIARDADVLIACVAADRTGGTEDTIRKFRKLHPEGTVILV